MSTAAPEQFGQSYVFGFNGIAAPVIPGFVMTEMSRDAEPEYFEMATDGTGLTSSITKPAPNLDGIKVTCSGYITDLDSFENEADNFTFNGRFFLIRKKGEKYQEKQYLKCDLNAESYVNVTGPAS